MSIGPTVLSQAAEALRKIRNSARFMLGNMGDKESLRSLERVPKADLGLVSCFLPFGVLHVS